MLFFTQLCIAVDSAFCDLVFFRFWKTEHLKILGANETSPPCAYGSCHVVLISVCYWNGRRIPMLLLKSSPFFVALNIKTFLGFHWLLRIFCGFIKSSHKIHTSVEMWAFLVPLSLHFFRLSHQGEDHNYTVGITPFADLSRIEFSSKYGTGRRLWPQNMTEPLWKHMKTLVLLIKSHDMDVIDNHMIVQLIYVYILYTDLYTCNSANVWNVASNLNVGRWW